MRYVLTVLFLLVFFLGACAPAPETPPSSSLPPFSLTFNNWKKFETPIILRNSTGTAFEFAPIGEHFIQVTLMSGMTRGGTQTVKADVNPLVIPIVTDLSTDDTLYFHMSGPIVFILHNNEVWYTDEHINLSADIYEFFIPNDPNTWPEEWKQA